MREGNDGGLRDGGRGGLKDDREAFPFFGRNGQRDLFAHVGGELDGGIFKNRRHDRSESGKASFHAWHAYKWRAEIFPKQVSALVPCTLP